MSAVSRYEVALFTMLMAEFYPDVRVTSSFLGEMTGCNPVVVRNVYSQLKAAGLIEVKPGTHGLYLAKDPHKISLWDIYSAVEEPSTETMFGLQRGLSGTCSLSENIHGLTLSAFGAAFDAARARLEAVSLYDFAWKLPDTYEESAEERLRIMGESLQSATSRFANEAPLGG